MRNIKGLLFLFFVITIIGSCVKIYYSPDAKVIVADHNVIAISPPKVSIAAQRKTSGDALKQQAKAESDNFQREMYSWLLRRKASGKITVEIQDIETTNAKLKKIGYPDSTDKAPVDLCEILGVDGIITSTYALSKPMSDGAAIALGVLTGTYGNSNEVGCNLSIHDGKSRKLLWNYSHKVSGSVGSSHARIVDVLMRKCSKKCHTTINKAYRF